MNRRRRSLAGLICCRLEADKEGEGGDLKGPRRRLRYVRLQELSQTKTPAPTHQHKHILRYNVGERIHRLPTRPGSAESRRASAVAMVTAGHQEKQELRPPSVKGGSSAGRETRGISLSEMGALMGRHGLRPQLEQLFQV